MVVNIVLPQHSPKLITKNSAVCFLEVDKTCIKVFLVYSQNFLKICYRVKFWSVGIIQLWFIYFVASFFNALASGNVKYLKIPEKPRGPHKTLSGTTCGSRVLDPWFNATTYQCGNNIGPLTIILIGPNTLPFWKPSSKHCVASDSTKHSREHDGSDSVVDRAANQIITNTSNTRIVSTRWATVLPQRTWPHVT